MGKKSLNGVEKDVNESNGCLAAKKSEEVKYYLRVIICLS